MAFLGEMNELELELELHGAGWVTGRFVTASIYTLGRSEDRIHLHG